MAKLRQLSDGTVFLARPDERLEAYMNRQYEVVAPRRWRVPHEFQPPFYASLLGQTEEASIPTAMDLPPEQAFTRPAASKNQKRTVRIPRKPKAKTAE